MVGMLLTEKDWEIRVSIYQFFVQNSRPPTADDVAQIHHLPIEDARQSLFRLNDAHQIFLDPGTDRVLMANPFSAIPTNYRTRVNGKWYDANCSWDMLGIAAMLHLDAQLEAKLPLSAELIHLEIQNGKLIGANDLVMHFALPVRQWYDDLVHT